MSEYVHCTTQEEWDFAAKELGRTLDYIGWKNCGDCITLTNPNNSRMKSNLRYDRVYTFDEWLIKRNLQLSKDSKYLTVLFEKLGIK